MMAFIIKPPGRSFEGKLPPLTEDERRLSAAMRSHVEKLAAEIGERNLWNIHALNRGAEYLTAMMRAAGYAVREQIFEERGQTVKNLESELSGSTGKQEILIVGAHYDSVKGCPAANDNGTGVAALLEIAKALAGSRSRRTVRFVFFTNEEPPFFQTGSMGSMVYAKSCRERGDAIVGMISLETIGCYSDAPASQNYPEPVGRHFPDRGNFIAFVADVDSKQFLFDVVSSFRRHTLFPCEGGAAPDWIPGVGWSDHWSFWQYHYPALMVTDTGPFRYSHYHQPSDTPDKIDYDRAARVTAGMTRVIRDLAGCQ